LTIRSFLALVPPCKTDLYLFESMATLKGQDHPRGGYQPGLTQYINPGRVTGRCSVKNRGTWVAVVVCLVLAILPLPAHAETGPDAPQLFDDQTFFQEPGFLFTDLVGFLESQPGDLANAPVECGGHACAAAEALLYASNTDRYSVNLKVLLALIEMQSGLVTQPQPALEQLRAPMGLEAPLGFEAQVAHAAEALVDAYYAYSSEKMIGLPDGSTYRIPSDTNAASYAIMAVLAELAPDRSTWETQVEPRSGAFVTTYQQLFGSDETPAVAAQIQFSGDGYPAFLYQPYEGSPVRSYAYFDHSPARDNIVVIYAGQSSPDRNPYYYDGHQAYDYGTYGRNAVAAADGVAYIVRINYVEPGHENWCPVPYTPLNAVTLWHDPDGDGQFEFLTNYSHLAYVADNPATGKPWASGDVVPRGAVMGLTGASGCAGGPHLHFSVKNHLGRALDPYGWGGNYPDPWALPNVWLWANLNASYPAETMGIDDTIPTHVEGVSQTRGWAINQKYGPDAGVDRVVVYLGGEARTGQYLGETTYGDSRPDVASAFGDARFANSGFHFNWNTGRLPRGFYTLYVYAHSVRNNNWFFHSKSLYVENGNAQALPYQVYTPLIRRD
jgi:hypothetical protein